MKLNKFKVFSYIGLGLVAVSAIGTYAGYASIVVEADPRIYTAAKVADISGQVLDYGGNYLWNSEVEEQNKGVPSANFRQIDFNSTLKTNRKDEWEEVEYWNLAKIK